MIVAAGHPESGAGLHAASAPSRSADGDSHPDARRILLVDDHEDTLRILARILQNRGHVVFTAEGVEAALSLAERESLDLLISDVSLRDGTGLDLMRRLSTRSIRGIAVSGFCLEEDIRRSLEAGFEHHLVKPIDFTELDALIRRMTA